MRDILYFKNKDGENFKMGEISLKYKAFDRSSYGKLAELRIYHPKINAVDDTNGDIFYFQKKDDDYYLLPELSFASVDGDMFLLTVYHPLLLEGSSVSIGKFIQTVYKDYFYTKGKP